MRYILFLISILSGCAKSDDSILRYKNGRQLLTVNYTDEFGNKISRPEVRIISPDSIEVGEEYLVKIFLTESSEDFVLAFTDCNSTDTLSIDTVTLQIDKCQSKLFDRDDTVFLAFRPQTVGVKTFQTIKILTKDKQGVFRTLDHKFDYKVVENLKPH